MKLRVSSGKLKGRIINISEHKKLSFRPTLESVRKSVINIIAPLLNNATVADICAGSGIMGIEMISRGAKKVVFVEKDPFLCNELDKNLLTLGIHDRCQTINKDVKSFLVYNKEVFDIIYYDPPYDDRTFILELPSLINLLSEKGVFIYERRKLKKGKDSTFSSNIIPYDIRSYGDTELCFFVKKDS